MTEKKLDLTGVGLGKVTVLGGSYEKTTTQPTQTYVARIIGDTSGTDTLAKARHKGKAPLEDKLEIKTPTYPVREKGEIPLGI